MTYGANQPVWVLEIRGISGDWYRAPEIKLSTRLDRVTDAARKYIGGDCQIRVRNILDGRTINLREIGTVS